MTTNTNDNDASLPTFTRRDDRDDVTALLDFANALSMTHDAAAAIIDYSIDADADDLSAYTTTELAMHDAARSCYVVVTLAHAEYLSPDTFDDIRAALIDADLLDN